VDSGLDPVAGAGFAAGALSRVPGRGRPQLRRVRGELRQGRRDCGEGAGGPVGGAVGGVAADGVVDEGVRGRGVGADAVLDALFTGRDRTELPAVAAAVRRRAGAGGGRADGGIPE